MSNEVIGVVAKDVDYALSQLFFSRQWYMKIDSNQLININIYDNLGSEITDFLSQLYTDIGSGIMLNNFNVACVLVLLN